MSGLRSAPTPEQQRRFVGFPARLQTPAAAVLFALVALGFFNPVLRADATFSTIAGHQSIQWPWAAQPTGIPNVVQSDQANYLYPIEVDVGSHLGRGVLPSWSRTSFAGLPTAASAYSQMPYPGHLLTLALLSPSWAHDVFLIVHVWLAGLCMFLLLRLLALSWLAAVIGGLTWMLCPTLFGLIQFETDAVLAATLPAAVALGLAAVRRRSWPLLAGAAAAQALLILGATIQAGVFSALVLGAAMSLDGLRGRGRQRKVQTLTVSVAYGVAANVLAFGLTAFVLVPEAAVLAESRRAHIPYHLLVGQLGLSAHHLGDVLSPAPPPISGNSIWTLLFLGSAGGLLVLVGTVSGRPGAWLGRVVTFGFLLALLGTPLTWIAYRIVPGFAFVSPLGRLTPFVAFGAVILAAIGVDMLLGVIDRGTDRPRVMSAVVAIMIGVLQVWQLAAFDREVNAPFQPRRRAFLYPQTPLLHALAADRPPASAGRDQRIVPVRPGVAADPFTPPPLVGEVHTLFGAQSIGGYYNAVPWRSAALVRSLSGEPPDQAVLPLVGAYESFFFSGSLRYDLLERLGVTTIVAAPSSQPDAALTQAARSLRLARTYSGSDGTILSLPNALPRAFFVGRAERVSDGASAFRRFTSAAFPFRTTALLEGSATSGRPAAPTSSAAVALVTATSEHVRLRTRAAQAGWVVLLESWAPGWSATVNGRPTPLLRADFAFRAVRVPAGATTVEMRYEPPGLLLGVTLSALALAATVALASSCRFARRRSRSHRTSDGERPSSEAGD